MTQWTPEQHKQLSNVTHTGEHTMTQAQHAIRAAQNWKTWGRYAATRYCEKRNVPLTLVRLARQLEALK